MDLGGFWCFVSFCDSESFDHFCAGEQRTEQPREGQLYLPDYFFFFLMFSLSFKPEECLAGR